MLPCFVCGVSSSLASSIGEKEQSKATFVVRILLELGEEFNQNFSIPRLNTWWCACSQCDTIIDDAFNIYQQLVKVADKFRQCQVQFVEKYRRIDIDCTDAVPEDDNEVSWRTRKALHNRNWKTIGYSVPDFLTFYNCEEAPSVKIEVKVEEEVKDSDNVAYGDFEVNEEQGEGEEEEKVEESEGSAVQTDAIETNSEEEEEKPTTRGHKRRSSCITPIPIKRKLTNPKAVKKPTPDLILPDLALNPSTKMFHCPDCPYSSRFRYSIRQHYKLGRHVDTSEGKEIPMKLKRGRKPTKVKKIPKKKRSPTLLPNITRNPDTNRYHCPSCDVSRPDVYNLRRHYRRVHLRSERYTCTWPDCGRVFFTKEPFQGHVDKHNINPRYQCSDCPLTFFTKSPLVRHTQIEHEGGRTGKHFTCEQCGKGFSSRDYLHNHKSAAHTNKTKRKISLSQRRSTTTPEPNVICDLCGKSLKPNSLFSHMRCHDGRPRSKWKCSECEYSAVSKLALDIHLFSKHKIGDKGKSEEYSRLLKWRCDVKGCRRRFMLQETYNSHMEEVHGPDKMKPGEFVCRFCDKRFFIQCKHKQHEQAHENVESKPFKCETCGKGFQTPHYLRLHKKLTHKMKVENKQGRRPIND